MAQEAAEGSLPAPVVGKPSVPRAATTSPEYAAGACSGSGTTISTAVTEVLANALNGERCACFDLELRSRVHGRPIQLQVSVEPKRDEKGKVIGAVCVGEDVALRRRMLDATMENYNLQKTNEAKDAFLAVMSHEMRTPLNGLLGMLQLAATCDEAVPDRVRRYIKQAKNSGTLLLHLINDILDITRIEAGQLQLELRAFSLSQMCEEALEVVKPKALEKSLDLQLNLDEGFTNLQLVGDMKRIEQVVLNLLWNALKFTAEGFVKLSARLVSKEASGACTLLLEVADSGIGIAPEDQQLIFQRFAIARKGQKGAHGVRDDKGPEGGSVGLGMSICKQLVNLMGGRIWLHSELGRGTRVLVQVTLNIADDKVVDDLASSFTSIEGLALHEARRRSLLMARSANRARWTSRVLCRSRSRHAGKRRFCSSRIMITMSMSVNKCSSSWGILLQSPSMERRRWMRSFSVTGMGNGRQAASRLTLY